MTSESYICKKEIDWSALTAGITLPVDNQVIFGQIAGRFLQRGEKRTVKIFIDGVSYLATISNENFSGKFSDVHKKDIIRLMYNENSELAIKLRELFSSSYNYLSAARELREKGDRTLIKLPDNMKEYMALYTSEYDDTYILDSICAEEVQEFKDSVKNKNELELEQEYNYEQDATAGIIVKAKNVKIRKLNRAICDNLKLLYDYRCQICGRMVGSEYNTHVAEAHHIDYFTKSFNNDADNQLVLCPNHHRIIHSEDPLFSYVDLSYTYPNGYYEKLVLNKHLTVRK